MVPSKVSIFWQKLVSWKAQMIASKVSIFDRNSYPEKPNDCLQSVSITIISDCTDCFAFTLISGYEAVSDIPFWKCK